MWRNNILNYLDSEFNVFDFHTDLKFYLQNALKVFKRTTDIRFIGSSIINSNKDSSTCFDLCLIETVKLWNEIQIESALGTIHIYQSRLEML